MYPCFVAVIQCWYEVGCVWIKSRVRQQEYPSFPQYNTGIYVLFRFKHDCTYPMCCTYFFRGSVCWQNVVWLNVSRDPNKISFQTLIKPIANCTHARFNFYKDDFAMHKCYLLINTFKCHNRLIRCNCKLQNQRQKLSVAVLGQKSSNY